MEEKKTEEQEFMPGTNIPRPRYRGIYETDEEYVEYLKEYYSQYFPEIQNTEEKDEEKIIETSSNESSMEDEMTFEFELDSEPTVVEQNKVESTSNELEFGFDLNGVSPTIEESETVSFDNGTVSSDTTMNEVEAEVINSIQSNLEDYADSVVKNDSTDIQFDLNAESNSINPNNPYADGVEIDSITDSNDMLNSRAKSPSLWSKAAMFFANITASLQKGVNEYFSDISDIYAEETVAVSGRTR